MSDVVIIGAGVVGMMTARDLALRGADVTVLDRGCVGGESSWAGGGIISALIPWRAADEISQLTLWGHSHYEQLVQSLYNETGVDAQWYQSGMCVLSQEEGGGCSWAKAHSLDAESLNQEDLDTIFPDAKASDFNGFAIRLPGVAQIRNPRLIKALHASLGKLDVTLYEHCLVESVEEQKGGKFTVKMPDRLYSADKVVVCAGAWAAQLMPELRQRSVKPMRGEMLLYKTEPGLLAHIIVTDDCYLIPRTDGHILCGSTVSDVGFDRSTTPQALAQLSARAECLLPSLKAIPIVGHWAGLRPGSDTGIPVISRSTECENLFVSCGHFRNGIAMAPASAQLMSDLVEGVESPIDSLPYALA
jgi:glycine oxidase